MEKRSENGNYEGNTKTKVFLHFQKHFTIQDALAGYSLENSVKKNSVLENKHIRKLLAKAFRKYPWPTDALLPSRDTNKSDQSSD